MLLRDTQALTMFDRLRGSELTLTQALTATMFGVRREGVTEAAIRLQRAGLIRCAHGHVAVLVRAALKARSCQCYAVVRESRAPASETRRLRAAGTAPRLFAAGVDQGHEVPVRRGVDANAHQHGSLGPVLGAPLDAA